MSLKINWFLHTYNLIVHFIMVDTVSFYL